MTVRARQRVIALKLSNDEVMASILDHLEKSR